MRVAPGVRAVQVPDENPMHPQFTSMYLVGDGECMAIDSGEAMDRYRWMLRGYLAASERAEVGVVAITHHHNDHSGNLKWAKKELGAEVLIPSNAAHLLRGRLPRQHRTLAPETQTLEVGGTKVVAIAAPGHSVDSVCYYIEREGVLFSGDTLLGTGTTTVHDLADYRATLGRLLALPNLKVICPGHGPLVHDPRERLQQYVDHRAMRERQILGVLDGGGELTSWDIMLRLYPEIDRRLRRAADNNVRTHLRQLEKEGRLLVIPGKARRREAASVARQEEHARLEERTIAAGRRLEVRRQREALRRQENPPSEEWAQMPRYRLVGRARD